MTKALKDDVYELTKSINERLNEWNVKVVMIDKVENSTSENESRIIFDYFKMTENLLDCHMKLSSKIHDHLSNSRHRIVFSIDLKHAYLTIFLHLEDCHYFVFTISRIDQVRSIKMQQDSQSKDFTMNELTYKAYDFLFSSIKKSSLLHFNDSKILFAITFYMNDFFDEFRSFDEFYKFLKYHFLSRTEWARLKLSFKKLKLCINKIKTLKVTHCVEEHVKILNNWIKKIVQWSTSVNQRKVKIFFEVVEIIKRWIKNFAEFAKFLIKLIEKVE